jgi:hypothetical protein
MTSPYEVLCSLRLEDDRRWGDAAYDFQREDARAVLEGDRPYHFQTRARGASKTGDQAGVVLALLLTTDSRNNIYWVACDEDQGGLCIDSIRGYVDRTPGLRELLTVGQSWVEAKATGARLDVLAADAASSWGLRPWAVFCDELTAWPETRGPQALWDSVSSAVAKRPDAKLVVLCTAGDPAHWSRKVIDHSYASPMWRVHEVEGPSPWMAADRIEEQRARLLPSTFARLFMNEWVASEDRLATPEELRECVTLDGPLEPVAGRRYLIGLDIGLKKDRTVAAVAHREDRRVVLDRMEVWQGSRLRPVKLETIEEWLIEASGRYNHARIVADPWQSVGTLQRLKAKGVSADEFSFTAQSVGRLASSLFNAIRDRAIALPPDEELLDELAHVRLRESSPGVWRMDHDSGRHDDRAIALGLVAMTLLQAPMGGGQLLVAKGRIPGVGPRGWGRGNGLTPNGNPMPGPGRFGRGF